MSVEKSDLDNLRIQRHESQTPRRVTTIIVLAAIVVLAVLVAGWLWQRPGRADVRVAPVESIRTSGPASVLNASGYVTARRQATVSSKVTGKVTEVLIEEGMVVEKNQLLARLDPATALVAQNLAEAQVQAARSALEETRVRIEEARLAMQRARSLRANEVGSQADLDSAKAEYDSLTARLEAQRDQLAVAERQLRVQHQNVSDTEIRAPFAGVVVSKNAQPGEMISPISAGGGFTRTGICTIVDMDSLEIEVDVNEAYINRVEKGQRVEAVLDAYPDWKIPAHVITVVPTADRQKATVRVRIAFDARDSRILPDMGVKVSFIDSTPAGTSSNSLTIPGAALRHDGDQDVVFVVSDGKVERRAVHVASAENDRAVVTSGLTAGESVVVDAPADLADGDAVKIMEKSK